MFESLNVRAELEIRRGRLATAVRAPQASPELSRLLAEVDRALRKLDEGSFGLCETCHDPVEVDRLAADPLIRFCIDHLDEHESRDLERDLELAAAVQARLLPVPSRVPAGWDAHHLYRPAGLVSGDYLDLVSGRGDTVYAVVGDVSGKGVAASLLMSHLAALVRALAPHAPDASALLAGANRMFCDSTVPNRYATLYCAALARDGAVDFSGAGHPPALLRGRGGVHRLDGEGLPIGMFHSAPYAAHSVRAERGDALVLYSDGVLEARNADGIEYGAARLEAALGGAPADGAATVANALLADLDRFRGATPMADDVTVLVLVRSS